MYDAILAVAAALILVVTLLPLSRSEVWWIRGWDFPRLQVAAVALVVVVATILRLPGGSGLHWGILATCLACLGYQTARILPYTPFFRREVRTAGSIARDRRLRILSANVLISNPAPGRLLALVRQLRPDVVVALETDARWEQQLDALLPEYPHALKHALDNAYGMHVYSRLPLDDARVEFLVEKDVPSVHATLVLPGGQRVRAHFLHPAPPSPTENETSAERDAELVIVAKRVARESGPVIVTGDLNDVAWSDTTRLFRKLSRLLDPRIGRGFFNTFHAHWLMIRWPLDHLFHSDDFTLVEMRRLPDIGSDHFPILVELALEPARAAEQEAPRADADDARLAQDKLAAADK